MEDFFTIFLPFIGIIILIIACVFGVAVLLEGILYNNNQAVSQITLDGKNVYFGMDRCVNYGQMGEVGNTYYVRIYDRGFWNKFFHVIIETYSGKELKVNMVN